MRLLRRLLWRMLRDEYLRGFRDGYAAAEASERERATIFGDG